MKHRIDITDFLVDNLGSSYKNKEYLVYEQGGLLYVPNYIDNEISYFTTFPFLRIDNDINLRNRLINNFDVEIGNVEEIICKCGCSKSFSAQYGSYEIFLICNNCNNKIPAYSG